MARPSYAITARDFRHAIAYVGQRIRNFEISVRDVNTLERAKEEYLQISSKRAGKESATRLQQWCDCYLSHAEWERVKSSIRKRRQRWAPSKATKTVTISERAHQLLVDLAMRDKVTLSDAIERNLPQLLNRKGFK